MNKVFFYNADKPGGLKEKKDVKSLIIYLFNNENIALERLNYIFCSDEFLLNMNKKYLNHNTLTDVITFPLSTANDPIIGEVYLSVERIKENANIHKVSYENELLRVIIHGALHLCGYLDKSKPKKLEMREKEKFYLEYFNVPREAST